MRALEKDRERRYETANALAAELRRFLNNEPVTAGPPSVSYRLGKFVKRQKGPLSAAGSLFVVSLAGTAVSLWQAEVARHEAERATQAEQTARQKQTEAEAATALAQERADTIRRNLYFAEMSLAGQAAIQAAGIVTVAELTQQWLPKPGEPDLRGWEWYYLDSLTRPELATLRGHTNHVTSVTWSPDGAKLASADGAGTIGIGDKASLKLVKTLRGHRGLVRSVDWSRDGSLIASGGAADRTVRVWDARTGEEKLKFMGHDAEIVQVSWNPDSDRLASTDRKSTLKIWSERKGREAFSVRGLDSYRTLNVCWSPDGGRLAVGSSAAGGSPGIRIVDGNDGKLIETLPQISGILAWSADGKCLAGSYGQGIFVWDLSAKKRISNWLTHRGTTFGISWSPNSRRLASCGTDHTVTVWDPSDGSEIFTWAGHRYAVNSVAWSPDGSILASGSGDATVKLWDARQGENPESLEWRKTSGVNSISWSPDGRQVVAAGYRGLKVFDGDTHKLNFIVDVGNLSVLCQTWSPNGTRVSLGRTDGLIQIWDVAAGKLLSEEPAYPSNRVAALAWKPDGSMFVSGGNSERGPLSLKTWDGITGKLTASVNSAAYINSALYDSSGYRIAVTQGNSIAILDSGTLETILRIDSGHRTLTIAAWSPDGRMLASGGDGAIGGVPEVRIWNASTGELRSILTGHHSLIRTIDWSHDGSRLASGDRDGVVKIWDPATGAQALTIGGPPKGISGLAWSPDGTRLLYGGEDKVGILDATKGYEAEKERLNKETEK